MDGGRTGPPTHPSAPPRGMSLAPSVPTAASPSGLTRARPASANTRLRQKPGAAGGADFFASLGVDSHATPARRGASFTAGSSNRSFSNITMRTTHMESSTTTTSATPSGMGGASASPFRAGAGFFGAGASPTMSTGSAASSAASPGAPNAFAATSSWRTAAIGSSGSTTFGAGVGSSLRSPAVGGRTTAFHSGLQSPAGLALQSPAAAALQSPAAFALQSPSAGSFGTTSAATSAAPSRYAVRTPTSYASTYQQPPARTPTHPMPTYQAAHHPTPTQETPTQPTPSVLPISTPSWQTPVATTVDSGHAAPTVSASTISSVPTTTSVGGSVPPIGGAVRDRPTQLFSMENEDLFEDDGWGCDSPSAVLSPLAVLSPSPAPSNQIEETIPTPVQTTVQPTVSKEAEPDEFGWAEDDFMDDLVSPVSQGKQDPSTSMFNETAPEQENQVTASPVNYEASVPSTLSEQDTTPLTSASVDPSWSSSRPSITAVPGGETKAEDFSNETKVESHDVPAYGESKPTHVDQDDEIAAAGSTQVVTEEFEVPRAESVGTTAAANEFWNAGDEGELFGQNEPAHAEWDETVKAAVAEAAAPESVPASMPMNLQSSVPSAVPVESAVSAAAASEFWNEDDDAGLFDHDDHANEDWDETVKTGADYTPDVLPDERHDSSARSPVGEFKNDLASPAPVQFSGRDEFKSYDETIAHSDLPQQTLAQSHDAVSHHQQLPSAESAFESSSDGFFGTAASAQQQEFNIHSDFVDRSSATVATSQDTSPYSVERHELNLSGASALPEQKHDEVSPSAFYQSSSASASVAETQPTGSVSVDEGKQEEEVAAGLHSLSLSGPATTDSVNDVSASTAENIQEPYAPVGESYAAPSHESCDGSAAEASTSSAFTNDHEHANSFHSKSSVTWEPGSVHTTEAESSDVESSEHQSHSHEKSVEEDDRHNEKYDDYRGDHFPSGASTSSGHSFSSFGGRGLSYGFQSSFAVPGSETSSTDTTSRDVDGSSLRSFGVSSAGATFGGSEHVSEGPFSDGTASETPSIVDSSNASTAFGTDFPSVSEGQFSAPGTAFGGSDIVSDGQFSDGNASETTSISESGHGTVGFVSEYQPATGHYVTETIAETSTLNPFGASPPLDESDTPASASGLFGASPEPPRYDRASLSFAREEARNNHQSTPATDGCDEQPTESSEVSSEIQSAASLFGSGGDSGVPSPFRTFGTARAAPSHPPTLPVEHELPTSDASDLFGSSSADAGFGHAPNQPTDYGYGQQSYGQQQYHQDEQRQQHQYGSHQYEGGYDNSYSHMNDASFPQQSQDPFQTSAQSAQEMFGGSSQSASGSNAASLFASSSSHDFASSSQTPSYGNNTSYSSTQATTSYPSASNFFGGNADSQASSGFADTQYGQARNSPSQPSASDMFSSSSNPPVADSPFAGSSYGSMPVHKNEYANEAAGRSDSFSSHSAHPHEHHGQGVPHPEQYETASFGARTPSNMSDHHDSRGSAGFGYDHAASPSAPSDSSESHQQFRAGSRQGYEQNEFFYATSRQAHRPNDASYGHGQATGDAGSFFASSASSGMRTPSHSEQGASAESYFGQSPAHATFASSTPNTPSASSTASWFDNTAAAQPTLQRDVSNASSYDDGQRSIASAEAPQAQPSHWGYNAESHDTAQVSEQDHLSAGMVDGASSGAYEQQGATSASFEPPQPIPPRADDIVSQSDVGVSAQAQPQEDHSIASPYGARSEFEDQSHQHQQQFGYEQGHESQNTSFDAVPAQDSSDVSALFGGDAQSGAFGASEFSGGASPFGTAPGDAAAASSSPSFFDSPAPAGAFGGGSSSGDFFASGPPPNGAPAAAPPNYGGYNDDPYQQHQQQYHEQAASGFGNTGEYGAQDQYYQQSHQYQQQTSQNEQFEQPPVGQEQYHGHQQQQFHGQEYARSPMNQQQQYQQQQQQQQQYQQQQYQQHQHDDHAGAGYGAGVSTPTGAMAGFHQENPPLTPTQSPVPHQVKQPKQPSVGYGHGFTAPHTPQMHQSSPALQPHAAGSTSPYLRPGYGAAAHTPAVKTSNKHKDPCHAPPSCLVAFGFGGNVVTMFPKRKLLLNIAGSSFRNSPRPSVPSQFENSGHGELRKGPVGVYRMEQLHPKDEFFTELDKFPGPLTENVAGEQVLHYLDERLKAMEATGVAVEDERLLLGVLRVLVKCNGSLRSSTEATHGDPNAPETMLIQLLRESDARRPIAAPAPRVQPAGMHPDLAIKGATRIRELLLNGERLEAVEAAIGAHLWPEALLLASFTGRDEYGRVVRAFLDGHYATGDPCRALFLALAEQQEKSVQEPQRLLQPGGHDVPSSRILSAWVSHAQVLLANPSGDTPTILTELGDRLWNERGDVIAAHVCYLLAGLGVEAPAPTARMALLGADHRTPAASRFYVSAAAVQRTEMYEWIQRRASGNSSAAITATLLPFQGYKLIHAMVLADHGKLETAFRYVSTMLAGIRAITATMKPGTSMYLEGMQNQLTVLDDRLRQHLGQARVASVAAAAASAAGKQGKWGLGSMLRKMGNVVNSIVEGNDAPGAATAQAAATGVGAAGLYAGAAPGAVDSPSGFASSPSQSFEAPTSQHGPSYTSSGPSYSAPLSHGSSAPGSARGLTGNAPTPAPFSGNGRVSSPAPLSQPRLPQQAPYSNAGSSVGSSGPFSNGAPSSSHGGAMNAHVPQPMYVPAQAPPRSNDSRASAGGYAPSPTTPLAAPTPVPAPVAAPAPAPVLSPSAGRFQKPQVDLSGDAGPPSAFPAPAKAEPKPAAAAVPHGGAPMSSGPASDSGKASPKHAPRDKKDRPRSKTPPPSGSKGGGWLSGLSSLASGFIASKMNPDAKVAKLGEQMEAYYDEEKKRWIFPGETEAEEPSMPSAPPTGPLPGSTPGPRLGAALGGPPGGPSSAPGSMAGPGAPSDDPLAALMAPPPMRKHASANLMKKDPLAAMMAPPPARTMMNRAGSAGGARRMPPRPQFAVFKPTTTSSAPASSDGAAPPTHE